MQYELSTQDVIEAAGKSHRPVGAGYLPDLEGQELPIRQSGAVRSVADIEDTVIHVSKGTPITIGQVAEVRMGAALKRGTGAEGGKPAVVLSIKKSPGTNTLELTDQIDQVLADAEEVAGGRLKINRHVMRQSDFIKISISNVLVVARDAAIIVAVILILFLMNVRTTLITLTAIPLAVAIALLVLWGCGESINVMTLGGLAVAIGVVVDDAIIFVENIYRRLRANQLAEEGDREPRLTIIYNACAELLNSVLFATLIIVIVFVPMLFLGGLEGRFFRPLGITYMLSIGASLLVALTVTHPLARCDWRSSKENRRDSSRSSSATKIPSKISYGPFRRMPLRFT